MGHVHGHCSRLYYNICFSMINGNMEVIIFFLFPYLGTRKVPPKLSAGLPLTAGSLICLAVQKDGPQLLSATDANGACAVYRVRCLDKEQKRWLGT